MCFICLPGGPDGYFHKGRSMSLPPPDSFDSSWTGISSIIYKLRHKLNADFIQTVYGKGYKILAAVTLLTIKNKTIERPNFR